VLSLITSSIICTTAPETEREKNRIRQRLYAYKGPYTFLFSYPRSGNTWLRYCLEWITQRPTIERNLWGPVAWHAQFPIDLEKTPIHRVHSRDQILNNSIKANVAVDKLIFILRHPHETIARDDSWRQLLKNSTFKPMAYYYFDNIEFFETWPAERRLLIHYEDLIVSPRETLTRILTFLEEPLTRLDLFMQDYEKHRQKSIALYVGCTSKGDDILFHSKKIPLDKLQELNTWIKQTYPHLWDNYLKDHYGLS
jgi:hypothetical protein